MKTVLGISAYFHDSAAALLVDGEVIAAAQEERFNRIKNSPDFPTEAVRYCLNEAGIDLQEVDHIVFFEKPFLKFERLLQTYYNHAPKGFWSFLKAMQQWVPGKLSIRSEIKRSLRKIDPHFRWKNPLLFSSHHLSHAASAFYPSPFEDAAILTIDAVGEWATASISKGNGNQIEMLREMQFPDSVGLLYSAFTYFLGFEVNSGEYKLMGLAPFGDKNSEQTQSFIQIIKTKLLRLYEDGSMKLNPDYFTFEYKLRMISDAKWETLFGIPGRKPGDPILQEHCNLAYAIQSVTEDIILRMANTARELTGSKNLCLAGGVALNCVANGKLQLSGLFDQIWVQPAAGDAGAALGAALAFHYSSTSQKRTAKADDGIRNTFLGPSISREEIQSFCTQKDLDPVLFQDRKGLDSYVVEQICQGKIIAWVQGRMEFGPRALGGRSILADPTFPEMQQKLNASIKFREDFRPFAPVMLRQEARQYFNCNFDADYMQFVQKISAAHQIPQPSDLDTIRKKLQAPRSKFQAITHVDYTSRLQVVENPDHPLYSLLLEMRRQSGNGILVNTSFNRNGEPIVCSLADAWDCFIQTKIDILVVENFVFTKPID